MEGIVLGYRRGSTTQNVNQVLLDFGFKDSKEAEKVIGKDVIWISPSGKQIKGKIIALHGKKGVVRAKFSPNLPGQAKTTKVKII
ncbi:MAG: 50S ribosomal protein L35ae [Candidatus Aenigmarchaeota archaeon]|nr:50S ribosomal protein L35ae [Candidatus Aenigmarchaeota archaeon]MBU5689464.1 50S ribosomal protein L35ae [Candidatus Aenigmarchaeota archaeon]